MCSSRGSFFSKALGQAQGTLTLQRTGEGQGERQCQPQHVLTVGALPKDSDSTPFAY